MRNGQYRLQKVPLMKNPQSSSKFDETLPSWPIHFGKVSSNFDKNWESFINSTFWGLYCPFRISLYFFEKKNILVQFLITLIPVKLSLIQFYRLQLERFSHVKVLKGVLEVFLLKQLNFLINDVNFFSQAKFKNLQTLNISSENCSSSSNINFESILQVVQAFSDFGSRPMCQRSKFFTSN